MSVQSVTICDRCDARVDLPSVEITNGRTGSHRAVRVLIPGKDAYGDRALDPKDLCPRCLDALDRWFTYPQEPDKWR